MDLPWGGCEKFSVDRNGKAEGEDEAYPGQGEVG